MKARVKMPYFDTKLHRKGEIVEVKTLNPRLMEPVEEVKEAKETKEVKEDKAVKAKKKV